MSTHIARGLGRIAAVGLVLLTTTAHADDRRLSYDPVQMILPPSVQFQSAARIGDVTLAVWGSTRLRADSSVATVMYWQLVRGMQPAGMPQILDAPESSPQSFVEIIALADRFLVLWNDDRPDGGLMAVVVDSSGARDAEQRLSSARRLGQGSARAIRWAARYRLVWNEQGEPGDQYECLLDSMGRLSDPPRRTGSGRALGVAPLGDHRGLIMLSTDGGAPRFFQADGEEVAISDTARAKFGPGYQIMPGGAVVAVIGSSFHVFSHVLDSVATRTLSTPLGRWDVARVTGRLDSTGRIVAWKFESGERDAGGFWREWYVRVRALRENGQGGFSEESLVLDTTLNTFYSKYVGFGPSIVSLSTLHTCSLESFARLVIRVRIDNATSRLHSYTVRTDADSVDRSDSSSERCTNSVVECLRRTSRDSSSVALALATPVVLTAPAAHAPANVVDSSPGVVARGDTVLVGWISNGDDTNAVIFRWDPDGAAPGTTLQRLAVDHEHDRPPACNSYRSSDFIVDAQGQCFLVSSVDWRVRDSTNIIDSQLVRVQMLTSAGWQPVLTRIDNESGSTLRVLRAIDDPDGGQSLLLLSSLDASGAMRRPSVAAIDRPGQPRWTYADIMSGVLPAVPGVIAAGGSEFLLQQRSGTTRFVAGQPTRTVAPALPEAPTLFVMGSPGAYVRAFGTTGILVQVIDTLGELLHESPEVPMAASHVLGAIARDRVSGRIALVSTGSDGVDLALLDSTARVLRAFTRVNDWRGTATTPSVVFTEDSLHIAWVDARRGVADVWATVIAVSDFVLDIDLDRAAGGQLVVSPNPARDGFTVRLTEPCGVRLRLVDALGRLVFEQITERTGVVRVPRSGLLPGAYTILLATDRGIVTGRVVLVE